MHKKKSYLILLILGYIPALVAQTTYYKQFWNELALMHPLREKYAVELDLASSFSDNPSNKSMFSTYTQFSTTFGLHYYHSAKLNFSFFGAYYSNKYAPEIGQREYPELRLSGQAIYFFKKIGYVLQSRSKLEYRLIQNEELQIEDVFRFRERLRYTKPFGRKYVREKTYYGIVSDEVFFKAPSNITGAQIFDRNDFTTGIGYAFTNNLTIDLLYTLQYVPRPGGDEIFNAIQLNFQWNNPFIKLKDKLQKKDKTY